MAGPRRRRVLATAAAGAAVALAGCSRRAPLSLLPMMDAGAAFGAARFPLKTVPGQRHLVDADGKPFLLTGDTGWSLLVQIDREGVQAYLDDRRRRGFNAVLVNLLEHKYTSRPPLNHAGQAPLLGDGDYRRPNEAYFDHAEWAVRQAAERGMLVLLAATYIGCCGSDGWYAVMQRAGPEALQAYGRYLGAKFAGLRNIMWVHGGDGIAKDMSLVRAVAEGIRSVDTWSLHTGHWSPGYEAMELGDGPAWFDVNNVYTYDPVRPIALRAYRRAGPQPYFLIESEYEGENRRAPDIRIRAQAWQAMLSGAMGQVVGNNPIWHFASPYPITPFEVTWQQALASEAAQAMTALRRFFEPLPWWRLGPDEALIAAGACDAHLQVVAARTPGAELAVVYVPLHRRFHIDTTRLAAGALRLRWFDPVAGRFAAPIDAARHGGDGRMALMPPDARNAGDDTDHVLLIEAGAAA